MFQDDDEETKVMSTATLAKLLKVSESELIQEKLEKEVHDEFWSDACWAASEESDLHKRIQVEHFQGRDYDSLSDLEKDQFVLIGLGEMLKSEKTQVDPTLH